MTRRTRTRTDVEAVIATTGLVSAAVAFTGSPEALLVTALAVVAHAVWGWTR
jgi:hypothetical protein